MKPTAADLRAQLDSMSLRDPKRREVFAEWLAAVQREKRKRG